MTVKELKEILECLIEDDKENYQVIADYYRGVVEVYVDNEKKEVELI